MINKMHITFLTQQLLGLVVKVLISILGVQGSIPIKNMGCGQHWVD
jgi:hypothetical protein